MKLNDLPFVKEFVPRQIAHNNVFKAIRFLIECRKNHCEKELKKNIENGTTYVERIIEPQMAFYEKGGHFSLPVYEAMEWFLSNINTRAKFDEYYLSAEIGNMRGQAHPKLIMQQATRSLLTILNRVAMNDSYDEEFSQLEQIIDPPLLGTILTEYLLVL